MASEALVRAKKKYYSKFDQVCIRLPKGERSNLQTYARNRNESVNDFICRAIREQIKREAQVRPTESIIHGYTGELYNADPNCKHIIVAQLSGGVKCTKCGGWFCY